MEIVLALASALLFAAGTVLQQRAGAQAPSDGAHASLLLRMARRPVWLAGIGCDALGFVAQAAALGIGRLAVVQPLLVASLVFALPLGARLSGQRIRPRDAAAAAVVVAALAVFLAVADPAGGRREAPLHDWLGAGVVCAAVSLPLAALGRRGPPRRRAALLGTATGVLFALSAALTKAVVDELHLGVVHVIASWELYALAAVGYASMTLNQLALDTGALAPAVATSTALDPVTSVVLGLTVYRESLRATGAQTVVAVVAMALAVAGVVALARSEVETARPA